MANSALMQTGPTIYAILISPPKPWVLGDLTIHQSTQRTTARDTTEFSRYKNHDSLGETEPFRNDAHDWSRPWLGCEPPSGRDWRRRRGTPRAGCWAQPGRGLSGLPSPRYLGPFRHRQSPTMMSHSWRLGFFLAVWIVRCLRVHQVVQIHLVYPVWFFRVSMFLSRRQTGFPFTIFVNKR